MMRNTTTGTDNLAPANFATSATFSLMPTNFAAELQAHLEAEPKLARRGRKILDILRAKPSRRRTRRIAAMERHVWAQLADRDATMAAAGPLGIDWSAIDWAKLLQTILEILIKILPLILMIL